MKPIFTLIHDSNHSIFRIDTCCAVIQKMMKDLKGDKATMNTVARQIQKIKDSLKDINEEIDLFYIEYKKEEAEWQKHQK